MSVAVDVDVDVRNEPQKKAAAREQTNPFVFVLLLCLCHSLPPFSTLLSESRTRFNVSSSVSRKRAQALHAQVAEAESIFGEL